MKKSLITLVVAGSFVLAGCSSSGSSDVNDRDIDPEWGVVPPPVQPPMDDSPEWGLDIGNAPDWGVPDTGYTPDRLPPVWGGPEMPPIDNGPEAGYTISGTTITDMNGNVYEIQSVEWMDQTFIVSDSAGNLIHVSISRHGDNEGDFTMTIDGETINIGGDTVQGGPRPFMENSNSSIDHKSIRDTVRARLNK